MTPRQGEPAPSQKSLHEIYNKIEAQQIEIGRLSKQNSDQAGLLSLLAEVSDVELPWIVTEILPDGERPVNASLAFAPDGQPHVVYQGVIDFIRYARKGLFR